MDGHFIVCGLGRVGYRVAEVLWRLGEKVVIITEPTREEWIRVARERGSEVLIGDARNESRLEEAGIRTARGIIATTSNDLTNTEIALDSKRLHPDLPVVVRIFDQTLAEQFEQAFDIRRALGMSSLAAPSFAAAALGERVVASFRLDGELYVVGSLPVDDRYSTEEGWRQLAERHRAAEIPDESANRIVLAERRDWEELSTSEPLAAFDRSGGDWPEILRQVFFPSYWWRLVRQIWNAAPLALRAVFLALNIILLLSVFVFRAGMNLSVVDAFYFLVSTVTTTGYGDISPLNAGSALKIYACVVMILGSALIATLYSIITDFVVTSRFLQLVGRQRLPQRGHFVVVGVGSVGFRVVQKLKLAGARVVAIDKNGQGDFVEAVRATTPVIIGDARIRDTLAKAGVSGARAVIAVTDDDVANLGVALRVRQVNAGARTVVRLFDGGFADKVQKSLNIDAALGAYTIGAPTFAAAALYPNVRTAFILEERLFVVIHRKAGKEWHGLSPTQLYADQTVRIVMRRRAGQKRYEPPQDDAALHRDDEVITVVWRTLAK